jgi:ABC-type polysaccharide/polyol phosphate export permease
MVSSAASEAEIVRDDAGRRPPVRGKWASYRELLLLLAWRDIKVRYKQSVMGFFWALLTPVLVIGSGLIVRLAASKLSGHPVTKSDVFSVAVRSVPWAFFVSAVRFATNSLTTNRELVTKIYFPREILPLASIAANALDFAVASVALSLVLIVMGVGLSVFQLWVPVLVLLLFAVTSSFGLVLSCGNLFFRDVKYLVDVALTYGIFVTPVFYSAASFGKLGWLLLLNPVAPILEGFDAVVVRHELPGLWLVYSTVWAVLGLLLSLRIFKGAEALFAESI